MFPKCLKRNFKRAQQLSLNLMSTTYLLISLAQEIVKTPKNYSPDAKISNKNIVHVLPSTTFIEKKLLQY